VHLGQRSPLDLGHIPQGEIAQGGQRSGAQQCSPGRAGIDLAQNDLENPNRKVKVDDVFGYSYDANVNSGNIWGVANYMLNRFDLYAGASYSYTEFWRTGNMKNGRFPENSRVIRLSRYSITLG